MSIVGIMLKSETLQEAQWFFFYTFSFLLVRSAFNFGYVYQKVVRFKGRKTVQVLKYCLKTTKGFIEI